MHCKESIKHINKTKTKKERKRINKECVYVPLKRNYPSITPWPTTTSVSSKVYNQMNDNIKKRKGKDDFNLHLVMEILYPNVSNSSAYVLLNITTCGSYTIL